MANMINCPFCGKLTDPKLDSCVHCGGVLSKAPGRRPRTGAGSQQCPNCAALVKEGDIVCVACGTNLLTGQKVTERSSAAAATGKTGGPWLAAGLVGGLAILLIGAAVIAIILLQSPVDKAVDLAAAGRISEATTMLETYARENPNDGRAQFELGKLRWQQQQYEMAAENFEDAGRADTTLDQAHLLAALCWGKLDTEDSRARMAAAAERAVAAAPDDADALFLAALAYGAQGDYERQVGILEKVVEADPTYSPAHLYLGAANALQGDYETAGKELQIADQLLSSDANVAAVTGMVMHLRGSNTLALPQLEKALTGSTPIQKQVLVQLGLLNIDAGDYAKADAYFMRAIGLGGVNPAAEFFHAICLQATGRIGDATGAFDKISRELDNLYAGQAAVQLAQVQLNRGDMQAAQEAMDRAMNLGASGAVLDTLRGRILAMSGNQTEALRALRNAIQADPAYAPAYLELGIVSIQRQDVTGGIEQLEQYLKLVDRNLPDARTQEVQNLIGELKKSSEVYETGGAPETTV